MMSLFQPSQVVAQTPDAASMIPISVLRQVVQEVVDARSQNLAFRASVAEHESQQIAQMRSGGGSGRSGKGGKRGGLRRTNAADLTIKPPALSIPARIPRNMNSMITWDVVSYRSTITTNVGLVTETNFSWSLTNDPQNSSWTQLFDQWCLVEANVSFFSQEPPSGTGSVVELHTAIDFDNTSTISTLAAIDVYASLQVDNLVFNKRLTRSCKPCLKLTNSAGASAVLGRQWCDSGTPSTAWFGIRSIAASATTAATIITVETTLIFAFRNPI